MCWYVLPTAVDSAFLLEATGVKRQVQNTAGGVPSAAVWSYGCCWDNVEGKRRVQSAFDWAAS